MLYVDPRMPPDWTEFSLIYRPADAEYRVRVENPTGEYSGVEHVLVDGIAMDGIGIPIFDSGVHEVVVTLGARNGARPWSPVLW
jgi:cellobiose phosphorylase